MEKTWKNISAIGYHNIEGFESCINNTDKQNKKDGISD